MKKSTLGALCAVLALAATGAQATETPVTLTAPPDNSLPDYNNIDISYGLMFDMNDGISVETLQGSTLGIGYTFKNTTKSSQYIGASIGYFYGTADGPLSNNMTKTTQQIFPLMVNYKYTYKATENFGVYGGAHAGAYISRTQFKATPGDFYSDYWWQYDNSLKIQHTRISPTFGIDLGFQYKVSKNWIWDTGLRLDISASLIKEPEERGDILAEEKTAVSGTIHTGFTYQY